MDYQQLRRGEEERRTFAHFHLLLQREVEELLVPVHDALLELQGNVVPGDLEEAIVEAAVADVFHELLFPGRVALVECFTLS